MTIIHSIMLGIVEGLTEFLPVSSTGHMDLVSHWMGLPQSDAVVVFEIAIQLGAILAVVAIYFKKFFNIDLLTKLFVAFLPTGIIGLVLYKYVKALLSSELVVASSLILGGIILIVVEKMYAQKIDKLVPTPEEHESSIKQLSYSQVMLLGLAQSMAIIPGVSRSGATIVAGLLMKIERKLLVEFTFLLAVPTMFAATFYSIYKNKEVLSGADFGNIFTGFIVAFIVALFVIRFFLNYIRKYDFIPFGYYRIILGIIVIISLLS